ncbi:MAG: response regulator [Bacteroidales bacterium]|nr:response regulator [Bacteroidales bacterium]
MKKIITYTLAILLLGGAAFTDSLKAEPLEFIYEHYSSEDGLPHNSICDIHQDRRGYLWLCTWYGLSRFDGNGFVNYTMLPGDYSNLSHNRILSIDEDACGYLWLMTYDYHLYRFDVAKEKFTAVPSELEDFSKNNVTVSGIHCDSKGNVWVNLSGAGLLRVSEDLSYSTFFPADDRNVGKEIKGIYEDASGIVYVASETGISRIDGDSVSLLSRNPDVVAFAQTADRLFFAAPGQLIVVDEATHEQKTVDLAGLGAGRATAMTLTGPSEELWVGMTDNSVVSVDTKTLELKVCSTSMGRVRYLFPDPEGLLWIATERTGIWSYDGSRERFRHYEHSSNVMSYYKDTLACVKNSGGRLWVKMNDYGFGYYDRSRDEIVPLSNVREQKNHRFMNGVACFDADSSDVLWMSTVGRGLERVTVITPKVDVLVPPTQSDDRMASAEVRAMLRDSRNQLWVATKSRELYRYSPDLKSCRRFPDGQSGDIGVVYSIFEDRDGNIWLGTKGDGLIRMTPHGEEYSWKHFKADPSSYDSLSSNNIYSIEQDKDGRIWIGTFGGGISMLAGPDSEAFVNVQSNFPDYPQDLGDRVRYLHCMPDGRMLVATVGGLIWFEPSDNPELTVFNPVTKIPGDIRSLGNNDVMHIFTDRQGQTWLCTFGGGLNRLSFENGIPRFDVVSTEDGLSSNIVLSAVDDASGAVWVATEAGLSKYEPQTGAVTNYTKYDGVKATAFSEATCASLEDGTLLFGTLDNVYMIGPSDFVPVRHDIRLTVSGLSIDGVRTPFEGDITIPHDYSSFRIDFASLDFSTKGREGFSYMLEGYDKGWIPTAGNNSATYSRIPPGRYVFKVSAGSQQSGQTVSVNVRVKPSFWNSPFTIALYVLLGMLVIFLLVRALLMSMKLRGDVRLAQDLNDIKTRFFTNISHELRTPLTLILGGIDEISRKTEPGDVNEYSVNMVSKNAKRMLTLVNQLLDIRTIVNGKMRLKVSQFDVVKLVENVYDDFRDMSVERQMEMRIIKSVDSLMVWGDEIRLEALVYNLLSNAFKYTSDGGKIEVGVLYREGEPEFRIMVKDNGIGVPKEKQKAIFEPFVKGTGKTFSGMASSGIGLSFCKEIADIHGGTIWVESRKDAGSKFFVRLPIERDRFSDETAQFIESDRGRQTEAYGLSKYRLEPTHPEGAMKVLVVEDNAELKIYIYNSLINTYEVRDASNGVEALQVISEGWMPDMIVTDLMMPEMDGIELINHIRNDFSTSHIPIVMITAKHEDDTHLKAMRYGADGYIAKPFTMELLMARIDNMLERRKSLISNLSAGPMKDSGSGKKPRKIEISPEEIVITDRDEQLIKKVMEWLEDNVSDAEVTVDQLAVHVGMGRTSMYNKIKGLTGKSPVELIQDFRMEKATYYLKSGQYSVSETSYKVGFSDPGYFSRSFKKHFGMTPAEYIKRNSTKRHPEEERSSDAGI